MPEALDPFPLLRALHERSIEHVVVPRVRPISEWAVTSACIPISAV
jgi:hypothetical protein